MGGLEAIHNHTHNHTYSHTSALVFVVFLERVHEKVNFVGNCSPCRRGFLARSGTARTLFLQFCTMTRVSTDSGQARRREQLRNRNETVVRNARLVPDRRGYHLNHAGRLKYKGSRVLTSPNHSG
jgi:hypothetical protein